MTIRDNYLLSNPEKLNATGIKQRNETEQINIKIGDQAIKTTDNIKLLGVNVDENLIFSQNISELCKKAISHAISHLLSSHMAFL